MKNKLTHFAIYIDDMNRAKKFYSNLFRQDFISYGQDDFSQVKNSNSDKAQLISAIQSRNYSPLKEKIIGFECSIEVDDIDKTINIIKENDGKIVMPKNRNSLYWLAG